MAWREIYFHEDDYCQQQLLPPQMTEYAQAELQKIDDFAEEHRDPSGYGWTDTYLRKEAPMELPSLKIGSRELDQIISAVLPSFDAVFTGYSSHRELCQRTAAWGSSPQCALFANWNEAGVVGAIWTLFFDRDDASISVATNAIAALGRRYPLVYVDWAWGYTCEASNNAEFAKMLRTKLDTIAERLSR